MHVLLDGGCCRATPHLEGGCNLGDVRALFRMRIQEWRKQAKVLLDHLLQHFQALHVRRGVRELLVGSDFLLVA